MAEESQSETRALPIGELSRRTGVSRDTLRFYERKGLLEVPARQTNGYRLYAPATVEIGRASCRERVSLNV